jgi:homoserine O-acetyltransferase
VPLRCRSALLTLPRSIQKLVLDHLGVTQIAAVIGGSMGGMAVLEWPLCFPVRFPRADDEAAGAAGRSDSPTQAPYIRAIVPIATAARHSAWCISWAEAQRQSIYSDPAYDHGYYAPMAPPRAGLAAARMAALLTYRSRDSFESRFGRRIGAARRGGGSRAEGSGVADATHAGNTVDEAAREHNEGNASPHTGARRSISGASVATQGSLAAAVGQMALAPTADIPASALPAGVPDAPTAGDFSTAAQPSAAPKVFSAQSYLRYQGDKFVKRFDANCYVHLTRKMDMHDVARGRKHWGGGGADGAAAAAEEEEDEEALARVLGVLSHGSRRQGAVPPAVLVVSIESDGLFAPPEQRLLHALIAGSRFVNVRSPDGHDGFLLEFEQINDAVGRFLQQELREDQRGRDLWYGKGAGSDEWGSWGKEEVKESVFGEVEDVTRW